MLATGCLAAARADEGAPPATDEFAGLTGAFVTKYCGKCHAGPEPEAEVALDVDADTPGMLANRIKWEKVLLNLQQGTMPPEGNLLPAPAESAAVIAWLKRQFDAADLAAPPNPGRVTMRRLNRFEYDNTIRDLLGVDFQPADDFPSDDVGYGFDNIGDVLSLPPLLMEKYLAAAERIAGKAILTDRTVYPSVKRVEVEKLRKYRRSSQGEYAVLGSNGDIATEFPIEYAGEYVIRIRAAADLAGPDKPLMSLKLDDVELNQFEVDVRREKPETYEFRLRIEPGDRRVTASFLNDFYEPENPDPNGRDRNLYVDYFELEGPFGAEPLRLPESHQRILTAEPVSAEAGEWDRAARDVLRPLAGRAFRRPVRDDELERLVSLVQLARQQGDKFEVGVQLALQGMLVSPHFLFRVELDERAAAPPVAANDTAVASADAEASLATSAAVEPLDDYQLASRLSYFLWSSMPDDALLAAAAQGTLRDPSVWEAEVRRMLADPKSEALVESFAGQWLQLRNLKTVNPDRKRFPKFDESLRKAMQRETELFFGELVRDDRSILDLLDADFTYVNARLAEHYGIEGIEGDAFQRVAVDRHRRGGILMQASVLTVTSNPTRTSPVKRGKWVLEQIFNSPPPPPPPNVPELDGEGKQLTGTLRQRMQQHRENVSCASCHQRMDPIGFSLENFDAIGAYRDQDGDAPIDASGELPDGSKFSGPAELKQVFRAKAPEFRRALAAKMLTYALGRGAEAYDRVAIEQIAAATEADGDRFSRLILEVTKSQPFQMRQVARVAAVEKSKAGGANQ